MRRSVAVKPASAAPERALVTGNALHRCAVGEYGQLTVVIRDAYGNVRGSDPSAQLCATLVRKATGERLRTTVSAARDPERLLLLYRADAEGEHSLEVTLGGVHVMGSPFVVKIEPETISRTILESQELRNHFPGGRVVWDPSTGPLYERGRCGLEGSLPTSLRGLAWDGASAKLLSLHPEATTPRSSEERLESAAQYSRYVARKRATLLHARIATLKDSHTGKRDDDEEAAAAAETARFPIALNLVPRPPAGRGPAQRPSFERGFHTHR